MNGNTQIKIKECKPPEHSYKSSDGSFGSVPCERCVYSHEYDSPVFVENSRDGTTRGKYFSRGHSAWFVIKSAIFLACVTICFYQSVDFYEHYFTYPLTTGITVINPEFYKVPAITFCVRSPFKLRDFCKNHPDFCEPPNELDYFCELYPHYCKGDRSKIRIPKLGDFTNSSSEELDEYLYESFRHYNITGKSPLKINAILLKKLKYTVVENPFEHEMRHGKFMRCYSHNLHLLSDIEPEFAKKVSDEEGNLKVIDFLIYSQMKDVFFVWSRDQVFLSIHSPFVPINPLTQGKSLEPGFKYNVYVRLEEEHLQPPPYTTNCTDYEALWNKNNRTGPRSQEMCKTSCYLSYTRKCYGCEKAKLILYEPKSLCKAIFNESGCRYEFYDEVEPCKKRCNPSCIKLKYHYEVVQIETREKNRSNRGYISVTVLVRDTDVTILTHNPLYPAGEVFSYVGGLIGCWLGISVWTCFGITEKRFRKAAEVIQNVRNQSRLSVEEAISLKLHSF